MIVSLDRPYYIAGQTINCSAYLIDPFTKARIRNAEDLVYFQLFNSSGREIATNKIIANEGIAVSSIGLPEDLSLGNYELVVYTNHLRNMAPDAIFRQPVRIFNVTASSEKTINTKPCSLSLYPEGGNLTNGLTTRVAVLVTGPKHKTGGLKGTVIDNTGKEISSFKTDPYGFANFYFKPESGYEYTARIIEDSINADAILPYVQKNGLSVSIRQSNAFIQIILECTKDYAYKKGLEIKLLSNGATLYATTESISKNGLILKIPTEELTTGLYDLEVRNPNGKLESHRGLFVNSANSNHSAPVRVSPPDSLFEIGTSTDLNIALYNFDPQRDIVITSITDKTYSNAMLHNLGNQVYLDRNLSSICTELNLDFSNLVSSKNNALINQLMLLRMPENAITSSSFEFKYERETGYYFLKGTLTDSKPLPDSSEIFFFIPEINMIYQITTDRSGKFSFPLLVPFYGKKSIMFLPHHENHRYNEPKIVQHDQMQSTLSLDEPLAVTEQIKKELDEFKKVKEIRNSYGYYKPSPPPESPPTFNIDQVLNYDYDFEIKISEYVLFGTMQEVIKELLPGVMLRTRKHKPYLRIYAKDLEHTFEHSPMIFIGGYPTTDVEDLLKLRPVDIKYIRTVENYNKAIRLGPFGTSGIMVIELNAGVQNPARENSQTFEAKGLTYHSGTEATLPEKMPLFDPLLLWYPYQPKSNLMRINVNCSERPSDYQLKIEAVINGSLFQYISPFNVRFTGNNP
ncbi:hypothetical protein LVD17_25995 [Fulvivirga ulvae]|uniref:hypothetical protein n=1 Tax=Fulvivirga ulvae TaxID=2904245 RepID=UPI001F2E3107|nr:hypothetical protein [Fulvivirga ulvae]UII31744.1 hypothetical protein LVD17_25995 [Fulvivirga ulvae]